ncbi:AAA family ATPase [candidate division CSSED10-310 bacterium]|uniref:AAA family ATPase n=1 Tax=candidate division CSSED10-310 bacterium TaxID=2855610 RepID=A0ABV6Z2B2_UNCC1
MSEPFSIVKAAEIMLDCKEQPWLIDHLWSTEAVGVLGGPPKSCKSWLGLDLSVSIASKTPCLGTFTVTRAGPALVYMAEDALPAVRERIQALCRHRSLPLQDLDLFCIDAPAVRLDHPDHRNRLEQTIQKLDPRFLLLDPFVRLHRADENSAQEMSSILGFLRELQRRFHLAVALVHHTSKKHHSQPGRALRGSSDIHAWTDSSLFLLRKGNSLILTVEHRSAPAPQPMVLKLVVGAHNTTTHLDVVRNWTEPEKHSQTLDTSLIELLTTAQEPLTRHIIRQRLKVKNQTLGVALAELEHKGIIYREKTGWILTAGQTNGHEKGGLP